MVAQVAETCLQDNAETPKEKKKKKKEKQIAKYPPARGNSFLRQRMGEE
jgi:hypothetical protein